jgi:hypothetical protein
MKKILFLLFVVSFVPTVSFAACQNQQSGDFEFSECMFQGKNYSSGVKNFWGNPKINSSETLNSDSGTGDFILLRAYQCGTCEAKSSNDDALVKWTYNGKIFENCSKADDQMMLSYVAVDVSEHGAEFCLTQFAAATWVHPQFFIYHQVPSMKYSGQKLNCAWYCEPGWDGDRCETKGLPEIAPPTWNVKNAANVIVNKRGENEDLKREGFFERSECEGCQTAAYRTVVLDYKKTGKQMQPWGGESASYQQEIVIGATSFMEHGIKARPMLIGAYGGHHACFDANYEKTNWAASGHANAYPYDVNNRKQLQGATKIFAKAVSGGKERVLCLQGYTLNENCDRSYTSGDGALSECTHEWHDIDFSKIQFDSKKHYKKYYASGKCFIYQCLNGMSISSDDNYACTVCDENGGLQGLCPATNKCVLCGAGKCLNKEKCSCDACSGVLTMEQMRLGPNKLNQCWEILDADEFKACVMGASAE